MQCLSCGAEIQPGVTKCPSCGTPKPPMPPQASENIPYDSGVESIPYVDYNPLTAAPSASPASSPGTTTTASSSSSLSSEPGPSVVPQQQIVKEKRAGRPGILRSTAVLLIILAGLIVVGGGGITAYATFFHTLELHAQATAVTQSILTEQARATAHTNSPQSTYDRITSMVPSFTDPLDGRHSSPWSNKVKGDTGCAFRNGAYHLHIAPKDLYSYCLATGTNYSNFLFQVQMTIIQGLDAGMVFRTANPSLPSYVFTITYGGLYALNVAVDPQHSRSLAFGRSLAINTGLNQTNLLSVMARDGNISLFINKHFVAGASDNTYPTGAIGLVASNFPQTSIDIAFNNAFVWNLP
ncbi:MAG: zinc ribbon domain-containing protein [Ktedonobacteraceae bacterium]